MTSAFLTQGLDLAKSVVCIANRAKGCICRVIRVSVILDGIDQDGSHHQHPFSHTFSLDFRDHWCGVWKFTEDQLK